MRTILGGAFVLLLGLSLGGCGGSSDDPAAEGSAAYGVVAYARRVTTADLTVPGTGGITGQVLDAAGAPRAKARVTLSLVSLEAQSGDGESAVEAAVSTSGSGRYGFANVPPGRWRVRSRKADGSWLARTVRVQGGAIAACDFSEGLTNLFFLHHSTGAGFVFEGDMRGYLRDYNQQHGTSYGLWDHGYNGDGLTNPQGQNTGTNYDIPNDNTDPDGLAYLWTGAGADAVQCRNRIANKHEVIAFKSCFPASAVPDAATLNQYKTWYLAMRAFFDTRPDRVFVVMSTPPLHRLSTNATEAKNARRFANWLKSATYLAGHANVVCFDLFDVLAKADDGSPTANMLRYQYEGSHSDGDSHPNAVANRSVGPLLAQALIDAARRDQAQEARP
jgi:hypothetical protein